MGDHRRSQETTGDHERPWDTTGDHGKSRDTTDARHIYIYIYILGPVGKGKAKNRPRENMGDHGTPQMPLPTDRKSGGYKPKLLSTSPIPLKLRVFGEQSNRMTRNIRIVGTERSARS